MFMRTIFSFLSVIVLFASFQFNAFNSASDKFFQEHQVDSESLVLGRVSHNRSNSVFSNGGFLGRNLSDNYEMNISHTYEMFQNGSSLERIGQYKSQFGLQGLIFSGLENAFESLSDTYSGNRLHYLKASASLMSSIAVVFFLNAVFSLFGFFPAVISLLGVAFSQWLVVFANNLYWAFFLHLSPFTVSFWLLSKKLKSKYSEHLFCFVVYIFLLLKSLCGYEYVSTVSLSIASALVFFAVDRGWSLQKTLHKIIVCQIYAFLGFLTALCIHFVQLEHIYGANNALSELVEMIGKRTHGNPDLYPSYANSLEASYLATLLPYIKSGLIDLDSIFGLNVRLRFYHFVLLALIISGYLMFNSRLFESQLDRARCLALLSALWLSLLAPISWHFMAKGHSFVHTHMNHVLWYMPFMLFLFVCIGFAIEKFLINTNSRN